MMAVRFSPDTNAQLRTLEPWRTGDSTLQFLASRLNTMATPTLVGVISMRGEYFPAVVLMGMVWMFLSKLYFSNNSKINALKFEVSDCHLQVGTSVRYPFSRNFKYPVSVSVSGIRIRRIRIPDTDTGYFYEGIRIPDTRERIRDTEKDTEKDTASIQCPNDVSFQLIVY